jgi:hypothetical protein
MYQTLLIIAAAVAAPPQTPAFSSCSIPRDPDLALSAFRARFKQRAPVIFASPAPAAAAAAMARDALLLNYGGLPVTLANSNRNSYAKRASTLAAYMDEHLAPVTLNDTADQRWYLFGDTLKTDAWAPLHATFALPFDAARDEPVVAWGVGGLFSGVPFHSHGAVYAASVLGRKRWWLAPPDREPAFSGNKTVLEYATAFPEDEEGVVACTVGEGETLYVPSGWWHATLNLDDYGAFTTVFVREAEATLIT